MNEILNESVFLVLNLKEKEDFSYDDIDEVKSTYYESFLKLLYPKDSNLKDKAHEYWNMHTYSHKTIEPHKIALLSDKGEICANEIIINSIERHIDYVKENCIFLFEYYCYVLKERNKM